MDLQHSLRMSAAALQESVDGGGPIAVLSGAGVSAESGIPTFRGAGGLWKGFRAEELATPEAFQRNPEKVWEWYQWRRGIVLNAEPNPAHRALARLEALHKPFTLITQNVDGLHQRAGSERVVELHGNIHHARCTACGHVESLRDGAKDRRGSGADDGGGGGNGARGAKGARGTRGAHPTDGNRFIVCCSRCGEMARPHIVWFGEMLPPEPWKAAHVAAATASLLLVVGTSAAVYPAAGLVDVTLNAGGSVIEINPTETDMSARVTHTIREPAGVALPKLLRKAGVRIALD